jgi:hypothetical protein
MVNPCMSNTLPPAPGRSAPSNHGVLLSSMTSPLNLIIDVALWVCANRFSQLTGKTFPLYCCHQSRVDTACLSTPPLPPSLNGTEVRARKWILPNENPKVPRKIVTAGCRAEGRPPPGRAVVCHTHCLLCVVVQGAVDSRRTPRY